MFEMIEKLEKNTSTENPENGKEQIFNKHESKLWSEELAEAKKTAEELKALEKEFDTPDKINNSAPKKVNIPLSLSVQKALDKIGNDRPDAKAGITESYLAVDSTIRKNRFLSRIMGYKKNV